MNNDLNKVAEDIGYNTGSYLIQIALWVFVAVCAVVVAIEVVQYLCTRKGVSSFLMVPINLWKRMNSTEKWCVVAVVLAAIVGGFLYMLPDLWGVLFR